MLDKVNDKDKAVKGTVEVSNLAGDLVGAGGSKTSRKATLDASKIKAMDLIIMKDVNKMSNDDIAKELGINRATLYRWKQDKAFNDELIKRADEFNRAFLTEAFCKLRGLLNKGNPYQQLKAIELYLKTQGRLKESTEVTAKVETSSNNVEDILNRLGI